jgi:hypothetical protein
MFIADVHLDTDLALSYDAAHFAQSKNIHFRERSGKGLKQHSSKLEEPQF